MIYRLFVSVVMFQILQRNPKFLWHIRGTFSDGLHTFFTQKVIFTISRQIQLQIPAKVIEQLIIIQSKKIHYCRLSFLILYPFSRNYNIIRAIKIFDDVKEFLGNTNFTMISEVKNIIAIPGIKRYF